jgi:ATP-dependent protease ClpP protease subunit
MPEKNKSSWYRMEKSADKKDHLEIMIYDEIGFFGITAKEFVKELTNKENKCVSSIHLKINSPGGSIFDGTAIYNALLQHKATKTAQIDGIAASMASIIAMSAEKISMPENTFMMIHNPFVYTAGDSEALKKEAKLLDDMKNGAIRAYQRHAKDKTADEIGKMMDDETWLTAQEAKDQGFAEEVLTNADLSATNMKNLKVPEYVMSAISKYRKAVDMVEKQLSLFDEEGKEVKLTITNATNTTGSEATGAQAITIPKGESMSEVIQPVALDNSVMKLAHEKELADAKAASASAATVAAFAKVKEIKALVEGFGFDDKTVEGLIEKPIDEVRQIVIAKAKEKLVTTVRDDIQINADAQDKKIDGLVNAVLCATSVERDQKEIAKNNASEFRGLGSLQMLARQYLADNGVKNAWQLSRQEVGSQTMAMLYNQPRMAMSMNSSTLDSVLSTAFNKALLKSWMEVPTTYQVVSAPGTLDDLKAAELYKTSEAPDVLQIPEGQAPKLSTLSDKKETATLQNWGRAWSVTEAMIINDSLNQIMQMPVKFGRAVPREINYQFWNTILAGAGPTTAEDGTAIFTAAHGNYVAAGTAISETTLGNGFVAMMNFTLLSPDGGRSRTQYAGGIVPSYLVVGPAQALQANKYTASPYIPGGTNNEPNIYGPGGKWSLTPVVEPLLQSLKSKAWLLVAGPSLLDHAKVYTLTGRDAPKITSKVGGAAEVKGLIYDIEYYFVVKFLDYRGWYQNLGA